MRQTALNRSAVTLPTAVKCNFTIAYSDLKAKLIAAKYSETADRVQGPAQNILPLRHEAGSIGQNPGKTFGKKPCMFREKALPLFRKSAGTFREKRCIFSLEALLPSVSSQAATGPFLRQGEANLPRREVPGAGKQPGELHRVGGRGIETAGTVALIVEIRLHA